MSRCDFKSSFLNSIKLVSDNLSERVKLDSSFTGDLVKDGIVLRPKILFETTEQNKCVPKTTSYDYLENLGLSLVNLNNYNSEYSNEDFPSNKCSVDLKVMTDMTMNSNLMFRSMFFMNDEATRHFLAPPIAPIQTSESQSEYFQKKSQGSNTPSSSSASITNVGNMNVPTMSSGSQHQRVTVEVVNSLMPEKPVLPKQRPHGCEECGKTFLMKHHLTTHMRVHTGERPHVCPECGKTFALKHCLSTHLLLHTAERPYKCPECSKAFTLKHHLVSHERVHTRDRPFECTECGQRFPQKRHLSTHIKFHSGERPFSCQVCGESFSREEHLVMHSRFHGGLSPYNCPDCGAGFLRKFELVNHERQHGRNPESCPNCGKEFLQKRTLLVHVRSCGIESSPSLTHQSNNSEGSSVRFNDSTPSRFNHGNQHRFTSENSSSRLELNNQFRFTDGQIKFSDGTTISSSPVQTAKDKVCKECGETFSSVEGLALHLRLHFGDHSFMADICSLAASLKQAAVNVATSLKKSHICSDCGRGFTQRHGLFQHRQRHANGSCKEKPFACEKCGKSFAQKNHLSLHERQHMDLPRKTQSQVRKTLHSVAGESIESNSADVSQRNVQENDTSVMIRQPDHTQDLHRIEILSRHASDPSSSDNIHRTSISESQGEMKHVMMLQQNHSDHHQIDIMNRYSSESTPDENSQRAPQNKDSKDMECVLGNGMMMPSGSDQRVDMMPHGPVPVPVSLVRFDSNRDHSLITHHLASHNPNPNPNPCLQACPPLHKKFDRI